MSTTLTFQAPESLQTFATRAGDVTSDANELIMNVPAVGSHMPSDLIASGCYVVPTAPSAPAPDPLQTDPVE